MTRGVVCGALALIVLGGAAPARAHLAHGTSWAHTLGDLTALLEAADPNAWKIVRHVYSDAQAEALTKALGFALYPQDKTPEFFVAHDGEGALLGVAVFIDARPVPKIVDGQTIPLRVGVAVDAAGAIAAVRVYDYDGAPALTQAPFLDQLLGRNQRCSFAMGKRGMMPVPDALHDSQLVADAGREALLLMATALGRDAPSPPCPLDPPAKRRPSAGPSAG